MAVPAVELKPRRTIALFDAALRLCARSAGVWSLTLPAGACVIAAVFHLVDSATHHRPLLQPVSLFTAAWVLRAISMGAACHFLEEQLLKPLEPSVWRSAVAALKRTPSLIITAAFTAFFNTMIWWVTLGIGFFFFGAHNVAYAVAMRGQGHPLAVYATATRLLGPARVTAAWVRFTGLTQLLVLLNLHLVTAAAVYLGQSLLALDLTFLERFTSLDNATWVAALIATTFALFEPLRAATAALLLIDGRVRQQGLDLRAALEQLPRRKKPRAFPAAALALLWLLLPLRAAADNDWTGVYTPGQSEQRSPAARNLVQRLGAIVKECDLSHRLTPDQLDAAGQLSTGDQSSLSRFVARIERRVWDDEDCELAAVDLQRGLALITQAHALEPSSALATREEAKAILARPEFAVSGANQEVAPSPDDEGPSGFTRWWEVFWDAVGRWLRQLSSNRAFEDDFDPTDLSAGMGLTNLVVLLATVGGGAFLLWLLIRNRNRNKAREDADVSSPRETPLSADPNNAMSRRPESWAGMADQLAHQGNYREAIRHLYLALLSRLHRDGAIDYEPAHSNWDYFRGFKGHTRVLGPFRELTRRFDLAWYGNLDGSPAAWATFREICKPILADDSEGGQAPGA